MTFPILVEKAGDQFAAALIGAPDVRVVGPTRSEAIAALRAEIESRVQLGQLLSLEVGSRSISDLAGTYRDDDTLQEISDEAYRLRDQDLPR